MLKITVPGREYFDDDSQQFITVGDVDLELEHSLASLSKWESIWEKAFLGPDEKTDEQTLSYVYCMDLSGNVTPELLSRMPARQFDRINNYITAKMTATWFSKVPGTSKGGGTGEGVTSELIYYWMIAFHIPFECQHWHLNRLLTLIEVCEKKNAPPKKMSKSQIAARNRQLAAERRARYGTSG